MSSEQTTAGREPYQRQQEPSSFWAYCPGCGRRHRTNWLGVPTLEFVCPHCGRRALLEGREPSKWVMPDIVGYEAAAFRLGIDGWIVGSNAPYLPVVERAYREVFETEAPPTFPLTSVPVFRGIGDPPEGYRKTRLLRALLEIEPEALAQSLRAPWREDPSIRSDLLVERGTAGQHR